MRILVQDSQVTVSRCAAEQRCVQVWTLLLPMDPGSAMEQQIYEHWLGAAANSWLSCVLQAVGLCRPA